jgi:hypothetical protein
MNNEKFEEHYNFLDEIMEIIDERADKLLNDLEIELEYEMREKIEKEYKMPWWKVIYQDDDYEIEDNNENQNKEVGN